MRCVGANDGGVFMMRWPRCTNTPPLTPPPHHPHMPTPQLKLMVSKWTPFFDPSISACSSTAVTKQAYSGGTPLPVAACLIALYIAVELQR